MIGYQKTLGIRKRNAEDFYHLRKKERLLAKSPVEGRLRLENFASRKHLFECAQKIIANGGPAAGPDRVHPADLTPSEVGKIVGMLSQRIADGSYRPQHTRAIEIPKSGTTETRTIRIANFTDRVVASALHAAVGPLVDNMFLDLSYGFRRGRNVWMLMAELKVRTEADNKWVLAIEDVRKAFDTVCIDDVLNAHRQLLDKHPALPCDYSVKSGILELIGRVLRGADQNRQVGIDQGNPYSPLALNVTLHLNHDVPMARDAHKPLWLRETGDVARYVDNLLYRSTSVREGMQVLERARQTLRTIDLGLKGTGGIFNLTTGDEAQLLGVTVRRVGNEMRFGPGQLALDHLQEHLAGTFELPDPVSAARKRLQGWVGWNGPAFEKVEDLMSVIGQETTSLDLQEAAHPAELERLWTAAWERWHDMLAISRKRLGNK